MSNTITDEIVIRALNNVLRPLGTKLDNYMPIHRDAAINEMRTVFVAAFAGCAKIASAYADGDPKDAWSDIDPAAADLARKIIAVTAKEISGAIMSAVVGE